MIQNPKEIFNIFLYIENRLVYVEGKQNYFVSISFMSLNIIQNSQIVK